MFCVSFTLLGCKVEFAARVVVVRERMETKEKESTGMSAFHGCIYMPKEESN